MTTTKVRSQAKARRATASLLIAVATVALVLLPARPAAAAVNTFADLQAAVTTAASTSGGATVTLGASVSAGAGQRLNVPIGQPVTLDLNGFALTITDPIQTQAAIHARIGASLTVTDSIGSGTITATTIGNGFGAAIGGDVGENGGAITVDSGTVNATAVQGAGIGGGYGGMTNPGGIGATVTINGGTVDAKSLDGGAGIGGGSGVSGGNGGVLTITGGNVTAQASNAAPRPVVGAGIGGGSGLGGGGGDGGTITISGGTVVARSSIGTGIGGGYGSPGGPGGTINLNGGNVTATSTSGQGAGIGGGLSATLPGQLILDGASTGLPAVSGGAGTAAPAAPAAPRSPLTPGLEYTANVGTGSFGIGFSWDVTVDTADGNPITTIRVAHGHTLTLPANPRPGRLRFRRLDLRPAIRSHHDAHRPVAPHRAVDTHPGSHSNRQLGRPLQHPPTIPRSPRRASTLSAARTRHRPGRGRGAALPRETSPPLSVDVHVLRLRCDPRADPGRGAPSLSFSCRRRYLGNSALSERRRWNAPDTNITALGRPR